MGAPANYYGDGYAGAVLPSKLYPMCVKLKGSKMTPGQIHAFLTRQGKAAGVWGFRNGSQYNVRSESMPTTWRRINMNRGVLSVDSFWEKDKQFQRTDNKNLNIGVLYNDEVEFSVITMPAQGIVIPAHHRMPLVLDDASVDAFLNGQDYRILDHHLLKTVA